MVCKLDFSMICKGGEPEKWASHPYFIKQLLNGTSRSGFPIASLAGLSLLGKTTFVHNTQFTIHLCPVSNCTGPFLRSFKR